MKTERVKFQNADGQSLSGRLELPIGERPVAYAIFAHCFTCSKNFKAVGYICRALAAGGIAVLRFDFTGLGESEGEFSDTNFSSNVDDIVAAAEFLSKNHEAPKILIGHSWGGAAVLQAASRVPSAVAVSTIASPFEPSLITRHFGDAAEEIKTKGEVEVEIAGRKFTLKKQLVDDLNSTKMQETIKNLGKALLVFHSPFDRVTGIENASKIFAAAKHPKSFVSLDTADHLLSEESDSLYVGDVIAAWAKKYVGAPETPARAETDPDNVVSVRTDRDHFRTEVRARSHGFLADEPASVGGTDLGAKPFEYLLGALGACTTITLRMYADRKGWPMETAEVKLTHRKINAKDCEDCKTETGLVDVIDREITLAGSLSDEQRKRLMEIADKCPVHKALHSEVKVRSTLKP